MSKITLIYLGRKGAGGPYSIEMAKALILKGVKLQCVLSSLADNIDQWRNLVSKYPLLVTVIEIPTYENKLQFLMSLLKWNRYKIIANQISVFNPDFIYLPMISILAPIIIRALSNNIKVVSTIHDVEQHLGEKNYIIAKLYDSVIKRSSKIVVLSKLFVNQVADKYGISKENIIYIAHANFSYYNTNNRKPNFEMINNRILFFGRLVEYKGLFVLLKAFERVIKKNPKVRLKIAGMGSLTTKEKELINQFSSNIDNEIRWISDDEVADIFSDIDFTIMPYIEASQSGVIPLSYSFGKCAIATNVGGLPEQIYPNAGKIIECNNIDALVEAILSYYDNPHELTLHNQESYRIANKLLTWDVSASILINSINN